MAVNLTTVANAAAQYLGVLDSGEQLSTQQLNDALAACNSLFDNWNAEGSMLRAVFATSVPMVAATQAYSVTISGPTNPLVAAASFRNTSGPGGPLKLCTVNEWAAIPDRQRQSFLLTHVFYDRILPNGNIYVSPVPLASSLMTVDLWSWQDLTPFADLTTTITLLPGYLRLVEMGLAIEIAPQYDMEPNATLRANYADAIARIRNYNAQLLGGEPPAGDTSAAGPGVIAPNTATQ